MTLEFQATGTTWNIGFDSKNLAQIETQIRKRINDFEQTYSRFLKDSFISKISNTTGEFMLPEDAKPMFDLYFDLYKHTNGLFTPLIGQSLVESGYDKDYSLTPKKLTEVLDLNKVVEYNFPKINIKKPVQFDMGGIGKGYLIDIVGDLLKKAEVTSFTIDAGGDILHFDSANDFNNYIDVGLEHPEDKNKVIGKVKISNKSICASSGNRRRWANFHHIIDPKKLKSPENVLATWVIAKKAITADALATCFFLLPSEKLIEYYNYEYLVLYPDFSVEKSEGFEAELYA